MHEFSPGDYPSLHYAADSASMRGQRRFLYTLRLRLFGLLAAAAGGGILFWAGATTLSGWIIFTGFLVAILAEWWSASNRPDRLWYEGRAAAESVKTLTWRFAMRSRPFNSLDNAEDQRLFLARLLDVLADLKNLDLSESNDQNQITAKMLNVRGRNLEDRRALYREGRILNQRTWYSGKARENSRRGRFWSVIVFCAQGLGLLGGAASIAGLTTLGVLGIFSAIAATATAWGQAKQYRNLSTAYSVTAQELAAVASQVPSVSEEASWSEFVTGAEEAISREHTLWRASRG